jgi:CheY-like chemotaxis protein
MTKLVMEDSRLLPSAIAGISTKAGYQAIAVGDGREGLTRAQDACPDIILLDMMLPTMEGTTVFRQLKKNLAPKEIPVVVLSGLSQKNGRKLLADGAAGYLEKSPLDFDGDGARWIAALKPLLARRTPAVETSSISDRAEITVEVTKDVARHPIFIRVFCS